MTVVVRRPVESEWEHWRDLRLRMLADTPEAFAETLETALGHDEGEWRFRVRRSRLPGSCTVVGVEEASRRWVGTMGAYTDPAQGVFLVSVFVDPDHRGGDLADRLLDEVLTWARTVAGAPGIKLHVHERNLRAQAFYRRRGFVENGVRVPYVLDPAEEELEMELLFAAAPANVPGAGSS